jgi:hypothetical protein
MLNFVTWHLEVGSALDTQVKMCGGGLIQWQGRLSGPRFEVTAQLETRLEGSEIVATARMEAMPGSHLFDMVLGCRLMCPPGHLHRPPLNDFDHAGTGSYLDVPQEGCIISWGEHGSRYEGRCEAQEMPSDFTWCPYIADEPDGWRLHARIRTIRGDGFRRFWFLNREVFQLPIGEGEQNVSTEYNANSPSYRLWRVADYRERTIRQNLVYIASICVALPKGLLS